MTHTLVTFLGKGREDKRTGYRTATYRFPDGSKQERPFFGLALADHLGVDTLVILGTCSSQWGVLVENLAGKGQEEDRILELMDAESSATVDQTMLDELTDVMSDGLGRSVVPRLIPSGKDAEEQYKILSIVADCVPSGTVDFDVTHGFRHLSMIGFLSAFMLERVRSLNSLNVDGLWYGALDMTESGMTPVLRLDGLSRVRAWVDALARFDASGDYGVFAPLLIQDGVPKDKVGCLERAAFYERVSNDRDAKRFLDTFLAVLKERLAGASGLFQDRLECALEWAKDEPRSQRQRSLALKYLEREDFVRAAVFGLEAFVTQECERGKLDPDKRQDREKVVDTLRKADALPEKEDAAYDRLNALRNALAHAIRPKREHKKLLGDRRQLRDALEDDIGLLLG